MGTPASEKKETLLIVDHDESFRRSLHQRLEDNDFICIPARNTDEARHAFSTRRIDMMLCDIGMSGKSEMELIRFVNDVFPETAVTILTDADDVNCLRELLSHDANDCLLKPVTTHQIVISVANARKRRIWRMKSDTYMDDLEDIVRSRTNILMKTDRKLKACEARLSALRQELNAFENALNLLLKKQRKDKAAVEENILSTLRKTVFPYVERLQQSRLSDPQRRDLEIIHANLNEIISPFNRKISSTRFNLTPMEIEVANLIKQGKSTKEIAEILHLSSNTIMSHRYKIRTKLGLKHRKLNLRTFLNTLQNSDKPSLISH